ncbi:MAG TPA: hypothetical protein VF275_05445 [Gammaproteobacteria bacterium]
MADPTHDEEFPIFPFPPIPEPIARYHFDEVRPAGMFEADDGQYVEFADHEAALAAKDARIADQATDLQNAAEEQRLGLIERDALRARIAELEARLLNCYETDRTEEYEYGEPTRNGRKPSAGSRWLTPKEMVRETLGRKATETHMQAIAEEMK